MVGSRTANPSHRRIADLEREKTEIEEEMRKMEHNTGLKSDPEELARYNELKAQLGVVTLDLGNLSSKPGRRK